MLGWEKVLYLKLVKLRLPYLTLNFFKLPYLTLSWIFIRDITKRDEPILHKNTYAMFEILKLKFTKLGYFRRLSKILGQKNTFQHLCKIPNIQRYVLCFFPLLREKRVHAFWLDDPIKFYLYGIAKKGMCTARGIGCLPRFEVFFRIFYVSYYH